MMNNKLEITKKSNIKGEDGYKVFSIRIKETTVNELDKISHQTNRSRNELINIMLEYGIKNCNIREE